MSNIIKSDNFENYHIRAFTLQVVDDDNLMNEFSASGDKKETSTGSPYESNEEGFVSEFKKEGLDDENEFILDVSADVKSEEERRQELEKKCIEKAEKKAEEIKQKAYEEGINEGRVELKGTIKTFNESLVSLGKIKEEFLNRIEGDVVNMVCAVSRAVINQEILTNKEMIVNHIKKLLVKVKEQDFFIIKLNPQDIENVVLSEGDLKKGVNEKKHLEIVEDPSIKQGDCSIETNYYTISANVWENFDKLEDELKKII